MFVDSFLWSGNVKSYHCQLHVFEYILLNTKRTAFGLVLKMELGVNPSLLTIWKPHKDSGIHVPTLTSGLVYILVESLLRYGTVSLPEQFLKCLKRIWQNVRLRDITFYSYIETNFSVTLRTTNKPTLMSSLNTRFLFLYCFSVPTQLSNFTVHSKLWIRFDSCCVETEKL
jgi:hypothetical protein